MGLPCGTASRAREKPVAKRLRIDGAPQPRPLRDQNHLLGLPDLTPSEQYRVTAANKVYATAEHVLFLIFTLGLWVTLENPERSWLWAILAILVKQRSNSEYTAWYFDLTDTTFDACQHGSDFAKTTRLKGAPTIFDHLGVRCDGSHSHANWKVSKVNAQWVFNTAAEAEYPRLLASRMVSAVVAKLPAELFVNTMQQFRLDLLQQADKQHKHGHQLVPEYCHIYFADAVPSSGSFKILAVPGTQGDEDTGPAEMDIATPEGYYKYKIGMYFSPEDNLTGLSI
eukprot:s6056_g2.t1